MFNNGKNALYNKLGSSISIQGIAKNLMVRRKDEEGIVNFLIGLVGGAVGFAILSSFAKPRCPKCNSKIDRGITMCPSCKVKLAWK